MAKSLCVYKQGTLKPLIADYIVLYIAGTLPNNYKNLKVIWITKYLVQSVLHPFCFVQSLGQWKATIWFMMMTIMLVIVLIPYDNNNDDHRTYYYYYNYYYYHYYYNYNYYYYYHYYYYYYYYYCCYYKACPECFASVNHDDRPDTGAALHQKEADITITNNTYY